MSPSNYWKTVAQFEDDEDAAPSVTAWRALPLDAIEALGFELRPGASCKINREKYATGTTSIALELAFDDGEFWVVRVRTTHVKEIPAAETVRSIESEVATIKLIKALTSIPVPTIFAYSPTPDNAIGLPYVVMSAVDGYLPMDLGMNPYEILPEQRDLYKQYCASLANIHLQLSTIRADKIGSICCSSADDPDRTNIGPLLDLEIGPFNRATTYYHENGRRIFDKIQLRDDRSSTHKDRAVNFYLYSLMFAKGSFSTPDTGPFLLTHCDLHMNNTLIDKRGNIVCVIDWDSAAFLPVELFAAQMFGFHCVSHSSIYQAAIRECERSTPMTVPGVDSSLASLHASETSRMLYDLFYFMDEKELFEGRTMFKDTCKHLFGTDDSSVVEQTVAFQEWYAGLA